MQRASRLSCLRKFERIERLPSMSTDRLIDFLGEFEFIEIIREIREIRDQLELKLCGKMMTMKSTTITTTNNNNNDNNVQTHFEL